MSALPVFHARGLAKTYTMGEVQVHALRQVDVEPAAETVRSALGVDEQRVPVIGDIHSGALNVGHDFAVDVRIVLRRLERATTVPTGALVRDGAGWKVYCVDANGVVTAVSVTLLARGAELSAVSGVEAGAQVVVYPPEALSVGMRVR